MDNRFVQVTGKVSPSNRAVWVNGVQAEVGSDGVWMANQVPVESPNGGTAVFEMTAKTAGSGSGQDAPAQPSALVSATAGLGTNTIVLNARQAACGAFNVHLTGTAGRTFILQASTNLVDWKPILTNSNSGASFDFADTNVAGYRCRFFRVVPIR